MHSRMPGTYSIVWASTSTTGCANRPRTGCRDRVSAGFVSTAPPCRRRRPESPDAVRHRLPGSRGLLVRCVPGDEVEQRGSAPPWLGEIDVVPAALEKVDLRMGDRLPHEQLLVYRAVWRPPRCEHQGRHRDLGQVVLDVVVEGRGEAEQRLRSE